MAAEPGTAGSGPVDLRVWRLCILVLVVLVLCGVDWVAVALSMVSRTAP